MRIVDANVHCWDQRTNPVFWLSDRSLVRDMLGDYESLPDTYDLADYRREVAGHDVTGVVWSDPGAADPVAAAADVQRQHGELGGVVGLVGLADVEAPGFSATVAALARIPLVTSVRIRFVAGLATGGGAPDSVVVEHLGLLARRGLVATIEASADQLARVAALVAEVPELRVVVDHFGWPGDTDPSAVPGHLERLAPFVAAPNVVTRIDAIGTIFGDWTVAGIRPWLTSVVDAFGADRCMLGSDLPIERLRGGFDRVYSAYADIFAGLGDAARADLYAGTAERWYGVGGGGGR
jgi:predicted TIM-barrel fold metal-dependent hydrolase